MTRHRDIKPSKSRPARAGKRPGPGATDWLEVERLYVQGEFRPAPDGGAPVHHHLSYRDLADRFGIRTATVADRGRIADWPAKRSTFSQEVRAAADHAVIQTVSAEVARYTERTMKLGEGLLEIVWERIEGELARIRRIAATAAAQGPTDGSASPGVSRSKGDTGRAPAPASAPADGYSTKELKDLAEIHAKLVATRRLELGLEDLMASRGKSNEPAAAAPVNEFSAEVARAVVAARAARNRAPSSSAVTPGSQE